MINIRGGTASGIYVKDQTKINIVYTITILGLAAS